MPRRHLTDGGETGADSDDVTQVLLVDDDPGTARLLTLAFEEFGSKMQSLVATSGQEALELLLPEDGDSQARRPDIVLLDVDNKGFDGRTVLRDIRETEHLDTLPIVVFSRNDDQDVVDECYELGATAYLVKPDDYEGLEKVVNALGTCLEAIEFGFLSASRRRTDG